jgi:hypothetical protein
MSRGRPRLDRPSMVFPMVMPPAAEPPRDLSEDMQRWWAEVTSTYDLDSHDLLRLEVACRAWDRAAAAREVIEAQGLSWCAEYERQLGGGSPLSSLMTAKD